MGNVYDSVEVCRTSRQKKAVYNLLTPIMFYVTDNYTNFRCGEWTKYFIYFHLRIGIDLKLRICPSRRYFFLLSVDCIWCAVMFELRSIQAVSKVGFHCKTGGKNHC